MSTGPATTRWFAGAPVTTLGADHSELLRWAAARLGTPRLDPVPGTTKERHWSFVTASDTDQGRVWIKADARGFAHEVAIVDLVTAARIDAVEPPLALDVDRGWLLLPDGGPTLRTLGAVGASVWRDLLTRYARVQLRLVGLADAAARAGVPDMRGRLSLTVLDPAVAAAADPEIHGPHRLTEAESAHILALRPVLTEVADRLAESPLSPTLEHNDPHPGNVFARSGTLFDWADAVVGHPFLGLANALPHAAVDVGLPIGSPELAALTTAYLGRFADSADPSRLTEDAAAAAVLSHLPRAGAWLRMVPAGRRDFPAVLPDRLRALHEATVRWTQAVQD